MHKRTARKRNPFIGLEQARIPAKDVSSADPPNNDFVFNSAAVRKGRKASSLVSTKAAATAQSASQQLAELSTTAAARKFVVQNRTV